MFPKAVRILDYYHAAERIWAVAFARLGEGSLKSKQWALARLSRLKDGGVKASNWLDQEVENKGRRSADTEGRGNELSQ
jgi:hypothetical protein